jgi:carbonic anhydrase
MLSASEALERLREGNRRFVAGTGGSSALWNAQRQQTSDGQAPFAIVLGCSDSRVPVEHVFDQGFGDLFVIRVAGNVAAPSQIGSAEFAAEILGARLAVVLGHSRCGAVEATLDAIQRPRASFSPNLGAIVDRVRPAVEPVLEAAPGADRQALVARAVRANVRCAVEQLQRDSPMLRALARDDGLRVVGAEYLLDSGEVEFFA